MGPGGLDSWNPLKPPGPKPTSQTMSWTEKVLRITTIGPSRSLQGLSDWLCQRLVVEVGKSSCKFWFGLVICWKQVDLWYKAVWKCSNPKVISLRLVGLEKGGTQTYVIAIEVTVGITSISMFGNLAMEIVGAVFIIGCSTCHWIDFFRSRVDVIDSFGENDFTNNVDSTQVSSKSLKRNFREFVHARYEGFTDFVCAPIPWLNFGTSLSLAEMNCKSKDWIISFFKIWLLEQELLNMLYVIFRGGGYFMSRELTIDTSGHTISFFENNSWYFRAAFCGAVRGFQMPLKVVLVFFGGVCRFFGSILSCRSVLGDESVCHQFHDQTISFLTQEIDMKMWCFVIETDSQKRLPEEFGVGAVWSSSSSEAVRLRFSSRLGGPRWWSGKLDRCKLVYVTFLSRTYGARHGRQRFPKQQEYPWQRQSSWH